MARKLIEKSIIFYTITVAMATLSISVHSSRADTDACSTFISQTYDMIRDVNNQATASGLRMFVGTNQRSEHTKPRYESSLGFDPIDGYQIKVEKIGQQENCDSNSYAHDDWAAYMENNNLFNTVDLINLSFSSMMDACRNAGAMVWVDAVFGTSASGARGGGGNNATADDVTEGACGEGTGRACLSSGRGQTKIPQQ